MAERNERALESESEAFAETSPNAAGEHRGAETWGMIPFALFDTSLALWALYCPAGQSAILFAVLYEAA